MSVCVQRFALQKTPAKGNPVQAQDFFAERFVFLAFGRWPVKQTTNAERWPGGSWLRRRLEEKPDPAMKAQAVRARIVLILLWWPYLETLILLVILNLASQQQVF